MDFDAIYGRSLSHKEGKNVIQNGKNKSLRARRNKKGDCLQFKESQNQHFIRVAELWDPRKNKKWKINAGDVSLEIGLQMIGIFLQGRFGDNKTPKPSILDPIRLIVWEDWSKHKGMSVKYAREKYISLSERELRRLKKDYSNPKKPGPDYYKGCFKGKEKKIVEEKIEEVIEVESQEGMMVDQGIPTASIVFLIIVFLCYSCCIGGCVCYIKRKAKLGENLNDVDIEVANIEEFEQKD